jgi:predicted DNA-binding transcriptional regulator YafY
MADTILRHWHMLALVPRAPRKVATADIELALRERGYDVDRRSIQRDLQKLSAFFPLLCDDRTKPFGWSWAKDSAPFDVPGMDVHGALAFRLAAAHLARLVPSATRAYLEPYFRRAEAVLNEAAGGPGLSSWPAKVRVIAAGLPRVPPEIDADVLAAVQTALLGERRLLVRYCRRGEAAPHEFDFSPLTLVYRETVGYVVGTAREYDDLLQLALHRLVSASVLERPRRERPGFDVDAYVRGGAFDFPLGDGELRLEALFDARVAPGVVEAPIAADQVAAEAPDGRLRVVATVPDTNQLRAWLRSFGAYVEVVAPAALREELAATAEALAALYRGAP